MHDPMRLPSYQKYINIGNHDPRYRLCPECNMDLKVVGNYCPFCGADTTSVLRLGPVEEPKPQPPTTKDKFISFLRAEAALLAGLLWLGLCVTLLQVPALPPLICNEACRDALKDGKMPVLRILNSAFISLLGTIGFGYFTYLTIINFPHKFVEPILNSTYTGGPLIICHVINMVCFAWILTMHLRVLVAAGKAIAKEKASIAA